MNVAVVIVGFRNADDVARCIDALAASTHDDFEVVIVENGGADSYATLKHALPAELPDGQGVRLIDAGGNLGFAGGVNLGIESSPDADAWWVLNPDTLPAPDALAALVARLETGNCDAAGGVLHYADGTIQSLGGQWQGWIGRALSIGAGARLTDTIDPPAVEVLLDYLVGASALVGRRFRETVGLMREDYFLYAEEIEWFLRGSKRGMRLGFTPHARVLHHQGTTTGWKNRLSDRPKMPIYLDERNRLLVTRDVHPLRLPIVIVASLLFMLIRFGRQRAWRQMRYALAGWAAGVAGKRGVPGWLKI